MNKPRPKRAVSSRLSPRQRQVLLVVLGLGTLMLADTLYLVVNRLANFLQLGYFAVTETSLPKFYQVMVLSHTGLGLLLLLIAVAFVELHLPVVWRRSRKRAIVTGVTTIGLGLVLTVTGLFILSAANSRENRWAFWTHIAAAAALPVFYLFHRRTSRWKPTSRSYKIVPSVIAVLTLLAVAFHGFSYDQEAYTEAAEKAFAEGTHLGAGSKLRNVERYVSDSFVAANYVPPESPFFPAATTTTTGSYLPSRIITRGNLPDAEQLGGDLRKHGFVVQERIGAAQCSGCHMDIVEQWSKSAHRFASFNNPFYEATIENLRQVATDPNQEVAAHIKYFGADAPESLLEDLTDKEALVKSKWCSGCHDPALMLAGQMTDSIDRNTQEAQAGLTCLACHAIDQIDGVVGNGNYNIADEQEDPYLFSESADGFGRFVHDVALKARPEVHKKQMLKPFFRTSEFCAPCHKVSLDTRVNNYRWLRGQDEYDNWHDSGVSLNAARTFYLPTSKRVCQDCHMPLENAVLGDVAAKDGKVRSHRFLAVNTALPFLRGDTETIDLIEQFLRDEKLSVDLFAMTHEDGRELFAPSTSVDVMPGELIQFDVVVRNKGVGHTFPGGTNDSNEGWLELTVVDENELVIGSSGYLRDDGHVDHKAHFFKALMVDRHGEAIHKRNAQDIFAPVYVRVIGPGTADVAHYEFVIPEQYQGEELTIRARLLWRKFDRSYTEFAFENNRVGFSGFESVPDLPITEIAADELILSVDGEVSNTHSQTLSGDWKRFNDYGIGLLLQGDTRGAMRAFEAVAELSPEQLDGPRNMARVALRDGQLDEAYRLLERCEELVAGDEQTAWVWGLAHQKSGRYDDAALAYNHVLNSFPEDRASWRNLGRVLYLDGKFEEALSALDKVLEIDPEDRVAHYHRMLSLRGLGREDEAKLAESAYKYYQVDESAQTVTRAYRLRNEADNHEAQAIHVHRVMPSTQTGRGI